MFNYILFTGKCNIFLAYYCVNIMSVPVIISTVLSQLLYQGTLYLVINI